MREPRSMGTASKELPTLFLCLYRIEFIICIVGSACAKKHFFTIMSKCIWRCNLPMKKGQFDNDYCFSKEIFILYKIIQTKKYMKRRILLLSIMVACCNMAIFAASQAKLTISNSSEYTLTIKIMKYAGGLHCTLYIPPRQSRTTYFSQSGLFYTKTKAEKNLSITLYKKDEHPFEIICNSQGYTEATMTYYVSEHGGNAGYSISKSEFENDTK